MRDYKVKDFRKLMKNNGFELIRTQGSHEIYKNKEGRLVSVPLGHKGEICGPMVKRLMKENNLILI